MVGRTPEYLGKKIEAFEMKIDAPSPILDDAAFIVLGLNGTAAAVLPIALQGQAAPLPITAHTASARSSMRSPQRRTTTAAAFAGLSANTPFWDNATLGLCDLRSAATGRSDGGAGR